MEPCPIEPCGDALWSYLAKISQAWMKGLLHYQAIVSQQESRTRRSQELRQQTMDIRHKIDTYYSNTQIFKHVTIYTRQLVKFKHSHAQAIQIHRQWTLYTLSSNQYSITHKVVGTGQKEKKKQWQKEKNRQWWHAVDTYT